MMFRFFPLRSTVLTLALLFLCRTTSADDLRAIMKKAAESTAQFLARSNETKIGVSFNGSPTFKSSAPNALTQLLTEALAVQNIEVSNNATFGIRGELSHRQLYGDTTSTILQMKIVDRFDNPQVRFDFDGPIDVTAGDHLNNDPGFALSDDSTRTSIEGLTVDFRARGDFDGRAKLLGAAVTNPQIAITGSVARSSQHSPYGIEVLVNRASRRLLNEDGFGFVGLDIGEQYTIRLINDSHYEAAVQVFVDGLSVFHFSQLRAKGEREGEPQYRYWIVPPHKTLTVDGWHKTDDRSAAFLVAPLAESAAAKLGISADIGTITANFFASWQEGSTPPPDEPQPEVVYTVCHVVKEEMVRTLADGTEQRYTVARPVREQKVRVGTKLGTEQITNVRGVQRTIGILRSAVSLRYEMPG